jgi:hypothetical protein
VEKLDASSCGLIENTQERRTESDRTEGYKILIDEVSG